MKFSEKQISELAARFEAVEKVSPEKLAELNALVKSMQPKLIRQLADHNIRWLSNAAKQEWTRQHANDKFNPCQ